MGYQEYNKTTTLSSEIIDKLQKEHNEGLSIRGIARKYEYSLYTIRKYIEVKKKKPKSKEDIHKSKSDKVVLCRQNNKKKLVEYKGGKCIICGYDKSIRSLQFHHINPLEKDFGISSQLSYSLKRLKKEADKCILVCSNCHCEIHDGLINIDEYTTKNINIVSKCECGNDKHYKDNYCKICYYKKQRKVERPPYKQLLIEVDELGYMATGRKYGVSDNSIRSWIRFYEKYEIS